MLNKDTKTTIQNARDVLVGKVPNPVSQIDLITTAMIYKFMDDMDLENMEFGGERVFFTDDLEPYAWSKLMNPKLGHYDRISLYAEALDKLQIAKQIPDLFRRIFKGAFLPFRDGATLTLFLNEINQLKYDNSENLGDAFEFLLSVMGSQGDAGQFRTPRHIIDFIVEVVNPLKTDSILDPACGTAGFLISAYKHIINQAKQEGKLLTPDEMKTLTNNINGYDISPDMVKLASVNLFLHQFKQPHIYEYDTLSSEDRWGDKYDVILANPPFMTPKGGIMPHNRFGVKSNRSEVLFVDYFMEHLNINGKAGFVVPEGIIFQSAANAYKSLRKMMVEENYLYAVVSLPSGVFNPYSSVKTSILFFDKTLAKKTDNILFVKVDNDGFDLGAQRRPIKENDIPRALEALKAYQNSIEQNTEFNIAQYGKCLLVSKDKIKENGEYNLTASRYEENKDYTNCQYEMVKLGDICEIIAGQSPEGSSYNSEQQGIPFYQGKTEFGEKYIKAPQKWTTSPTKLALPNDILMSVRAPVGPVNIAVNKCCIGRGLASIRASDKVNQNYLFFLLKSMENEIKGNGGAVFDSISKNDIANIKIPLPPLEVQEEIVKELDQYQAIIDGAQKVVDNWKPTFTINPNWEKVKIGDVCKLQGGYAFKSVDFVESGIQVIKMGNVKQHFFDINNNPSFLPYTFENLYKNYMLHKDDILISMTGTNGKEDYGNVCKVDKDEKLLLNQRVGKFVIKSENVLNNFLYYIALSKEFRKQIFANSSGGIRQANISSSNIENINIPLPPLEEQKAIVVQIEQEEQYVDACKKLIEINQQKITNKINSIWNSED